MLKPEHLESIRDTAEWLFGLMSLRLDITVYSVAGNIQINLTGEDRAYLITDHGETILSLQYLLARIIRQRVPEAENCRIYLDSDGYLLRHEQSVRRMAADTVRQVRSRRRSMKLPPMNPFDRRVVHTEVARTGDLESISEGDGFIKQIVVRRKYYRQKQ